MSKPRPHPLLRLPPEDLDLVQELVVQSGSLKGLAKAYGVSYPTIRGRLDRVIERLREVLEGREPDPVAERLGTLVRRGEMTPDAARAVLEAVREERAARERSGKRVAEGAVGQPVKRANEKEVADGVVE